MQLHFVCLIICPKMMPQNVQMLDMQPEATTTDNTQATPNATAGGPDTNLKHWQA
jgi:hypothetical protein